MFYCVAAQVIEYDAGAYTQRYAVVGLVCYGYVFDGRMQYRTCKVAREEQIVASSDV